MKGTHLDLDVQMSQLESEWRRAYEASVAARADYQKLAAQSGANAELLDLARERLDRAEACKARLMVRMERLESEIIGQN
jgi:hypothetical protein